MSRTSHVRAVLLLFLLGSFLVVPTPPKAVAAGPLTLPSGFIDELVVGDLFVTYAWVWTPDGRMLIAEHGTAAQPNEINMASIRVFKNGVLLPTRAVSFDVAGSGERGFLGIAVDPNFTSNGYVYTYYTRPSLNTNCNGELITSPSYTACNRVSRWTMVGDTIDSSTEKVLVDNIANYTGIHNAGDLQFGADGNLYITTGEGGSSNSPSRNPTILVGKILRIRPDAAVPSGYTIPSDNPFLATSGSRLCGALPMPAGNGPCQEIYAIGLRNPFRATIKPGTSTLYAFDVGGGQWEEINEIVNGGDYGYPTIEGPCPNGQDCGGPVGTYYDPIFAYPHTGGTTTSDDAAIIGGTFYTGASYPSQYANNLFYADFIRGWIHRLVPGPNNTWSDATFASDGISIIGVRTGPDTNIYYQTSSEIRRIRYEAGANQPPTARMSVNPINGPLSTNFSFSGAASTDPEASPLTYNWDFGDGTSQSTSTATVSHIYSAAGAKTVTLTVTDSGTPAATSEPVTVQVFPGNNPPTGEIVITNNTDSARSKYYAGDSWSFSVANLSDDQTPVQNIQVKWTVNFHHREHFHPFIAQFTGTGGTMAIPTSGEYDHVVWYRVIMELTDGQGQTVAIERDIFPEVTTLTFTSDPTGVPIIIDANPIVATASISRVVGYNSGVSVLNHFPTAGQSQVFVGWNDGNSQNPRVLVVPVNGGTYQVRYAYLPWRIFSPLVPRAVDP